MDRRVGSSLLLSLLALSCAGSEGALETATSEAALTVLPARIQAEDFDAGGEGVGYHDTTAANIGGLYRPSEGVDIAAFYPDVGGGYEVGWIVAGEWLRYTVVARSAGYYFLRLRLAQYGAGGCFHVDVDGVSATPRIEVPNTGSYENWITLPVGRVFLTPGRHVIQLSFDVNGTNGGVMNLNWFELEPINRTVPGRIQAEDYDPSGFFDTTSANQGGAYRTDAVDIGDDFTDEDGTFEVGWIVAGEWLSYSIFVTGEADYSLRMRYAEVEPGATFRVRVDGNYVTDVLTVPSTGAYANWHTVPVAMVHLRGGRHTIRFDFLQNGANGGVMNLNWFELVPPPNRVPGRIQAEDFDFGGQGVAYVDSTSTNLPGAYRPTEAVDIHWNFAPDEDLTPVIGYVVAGEWLRYTIDVTEAGEYAVGVRFSEYGTGGVFHVEVDGTDVSGPIATPDTSTYANFITVRAATVSLSEGPHVVRLVFDQNGTNGGVMNLNWIELEHPSANEVENREAGTLEWAFVQPSGDIKGFAEPQTVNKGGLVHFRVYSREPFTLDVFRLGYYQSYYGRRMMTPVELPAADQPVCTGTPLVCPWSSSLDLVIPTTWPSGMYVARISQLDRSDENYVPFLVRDDGRVADLLYVHPDTTYEAYNNFPSFACWAQETGFSLYDFNSNGGLRTPEVSFLRPACGTGAGYAGGEDGDLFQMELPLIAWLEREGYDVTYVTSRDLARIPPPILAQYRGIISAGHDEYWTREMRDRMEYARDHRVNLGFFGSNGAYWQVRLEAGGDHMIGYKDAALDPIDDPSLETILWRDLGRDEQALMGVHFGDCCFFANDYYPLVVRDAGSWVWAAAGVSDDTEIPGLLGHEIDFIDPAGASPPFEIPGTRVHLAHRDLALNGPHDAVAFQSYSGAWTFSTGSLGYTLGLERTIGYDRVSPALQRATHNVVDRFLAR